MTIAMIGIGNAQSGGAVTSLSQSLSDTSRLSIGDTKNENVGNNAILLAVPDYVTSRIQEFNQSILHINDGIASSQIAVKGLQSLQTDVKQLVELARQSANEFLDNQSRASLQQKAEPIQQQIIHTEANTQYNGTPVLTTSNGENASPVQLPNLSARVAAIDISTQSGAKNAVSTLSGDMRLITNAQQQFSSVQSNLATSADTLLASSKSLIESKGRSISSADIGQIVNATAEAIRIQPGLAIQAQANQSASQVQGLL
ncbi:MAG: hypothetical protein HQL94_00210 [Magnetococcales bacterium]|nr:hypothetical protein [Magnetococcales bacterium]MBF0437582.1 hypothetical protein [Magnetococcales bacterium]